MPCLTCVDHDVEAIIYAMCATVTNVHQRDVLAKATPSSCYPSLLWLSFSFGVVAR